MDSQSNKFYAKIKALINKTTADRVAIFFAAFLLVIMFASAVSSMKDDTATFDELAHVPAGYSYLTQQDYRMNPEHPPLIKDLAAVPLLFLHLNFPKDSDAWKKTDEWSLGTEFLYKSGNDADKIMFWARLPMVFVLVFLGWFVFYWTRKLAGNKSALMALVIFSFCPNFLANGRLVTTDVGAAFGAVLSLFFWIRFLDDPSRKNIILAGLAFGIAMITKFSLLMLLPILGVITIIYAWLKTNDSKQILKYVGKGILVGLIGAVFIIWPVYYLHLLHYPAEKQLADTQGILEFGGVDSKESTCLWMIDRPALRPFAHYCFGVVMAIERNDNLTTWWLPYLLGEISSDGYFWYYFIDLYLLKVPLAFHILTLIAFFGVAGILWKKRSSRIKENLKIWFLRYFSEIAMLVFVLGYWIVALNSKLNIGVRHLLPIFPFMYILVAVATVKTIEAVKTPKYKKIMTAAVILLLVWFAVSSLSVYPYYLTYYNELAGGAQSGYQVAVDSNYDWGQDLKRLAKWVNDNKVNTIYVDYFGTADLDYYLKGKYVHWMGSSWWIDSGWQNTGKVPGGTYFAVSATFLQEGRATPTSIMDSRGSEYKWLDDYRPVARIGNSIFIYYIN